MTLDEFANALKYDIRRFKNMWIMKRAKTDEADKDKFWPIDLPLAEWQEQFLAWIEENEQSTNRPESNQSNEEIY